MSTTSVDRENIPVVPSTGASEGGDDAGRLRRFHLGATASDPLPADIVPLAMRGSGCGTSALHYPVG